MCSLINSYSDFFSSFALYIIISLYSVINVFLLHIKCPPLKSFDSQKDKTSTFVFLIVSFRGSSTSCWYIYMITAPQFELSKPCSSSSHKSDFPLSIHLTTVCSTAAWGAAAPCWQKQPIAAALRRSADTPGSVRSAGSRRSSQLILDLQPLEVLDAPSRFCRFWRFWSSARMVRSFLIHTVCPLTALGPGDSRVLYSRGFGPELGPEPGPGAGPGLGPEQRRLLLKEEAAVVSRWVWGAEEQRSSSALGDDSHWQSLTVCHWLSVGLTLLFKTKTKQNHQLKAEQRHRTSEKTKSTCYYFPPISLNKAQNHLKHFQDFNHLMLLLLFEICIIFHINTIVLNIINSTCQSLLTTLTYAIWTISNKIVQIASVFVMNCQAIIHILLLYSV